MGDRGGRKRRRVPEGDFREKYPQARLAPSIAQLSFTLYDIDAAANLGESAASAPGAGGGVVCGCDGVWMPPMIWLRIQCVIADSAVCTHDETAS